MCIDMKMMNGHYLIILISCNLILMHFDLRNF